MITSQNQNKPIEAVLIIDMLFGGKQFRAGETVELKPSDFKYFHHLGRVDHATKENVAAVKAKLAAAQAAVESAQKVAADQALAQFTDAKALKARLAQLEAEAKGK